MGITCLWIPPACKACWGGSTGYDAYDLYDLGEFDQKGGVRTKYGTKEELQRLVGKAGAAGVDVLFDVIVNHKAGAEYTEPVRGVRVEQYDRLKEVTGGLEDIEAWTGFDYPARGDKYSSFKWNKSHFSGVDFDEKTKDYAIWRLEGKRWAHDADEDRGNYDYLMFANIDHLHPDVREELLHWISWLGSQLRLGGIRFDAIKHISKDFQWDVVSHIRQAISHDWLIIGEYWHLDAGFLAELVERFDHQMMLFDIPLVHNFRGLSEAPEWEVDLRTVFDGSLGRLKPGHSVSFVVNHDTQEGQTSETLVEPWFVPLAYALILLYEGAGTPCVFYGDLYGSFGPKDGRGEGTLELPPYHAGVARMVLARRHYAYGAQTEYFDGPRCVGFTRHGHALRSAGAGLAVLLNASSSPQRAKKTMYVGIQHAGECWTDLLGAGSGQEDGVVIDEHGFATFSAGPRSVAIWVDAAADARDVVDNFALDHDIYGLMGSEKMDQSQD
ncbi:hypothetical protein DL769_006289 [Monosporascus sp. CRB-8-3]|nr:hypothetical protein DL769_006289 [Monosporascus sp. CRB-8-3]